MKSRPPMILAALMVTGGILSFFAGWWLMLGGALESVAGIQAGMPNVILGSLTFAVGLTSFLVAYGFWRVKAWAWGAAFVVVGVGVALELGGVVFADANIFTIVASLAFAGITTWYLLKPATKELFGRQATGTPVLA
jgi:hypothetical protein